jgi:hypothetical protein
MFNIYLLGVSQIMYILWMRTEKGEKISKMFYQHMPGTIEIWAIVKACTV